MKERLATVQARLVAVGGLLPPWGWGLVALGLAIVYPFLVNPILGTLNGGDFMQKSVEALGYVMMALGLNIVVGFAGLLDLGYVAFFAIGAFVMGWLSSLQFYHAHVHILVSKSVSATFPQGIHVNFVFVVIVAAVFTMMWGAILGFPTLRLRGDYLAIVTLAFGEIVPRFFQNIPKLSNGTQGITPVDHISFPGVADSVFNYPIALKGVYYVALVMVLVVIYFNISLRDSRLGRAWVAIREDEVAAAAMGVNLVRTKLWAYGFGAAFGGFAGAFLGTFRNTVNTSNFNFGQSVFILCMIIIGGMGNVAGVIVGALLLYMVNAEIFPKLTDVAHTFHIGVDFTALQFGVFGFFLLLTMVLRPAGLFPSRRRKLELTHGELVADTPLYEVQQ
jgi:branched-chain amino acid transport system permease protein